MGSDQRPRSRETGGGLLGSPPCLHRRATSGETLLLPKFGISAGGGMGQRAPTPELLGAPPPEGTDADTLSVMACN